MKKIYEAIATYTPGESEFVKWLSFYLQTAFAETARYRTERTRKDPSKSAISLVRTLTDDSDPTIGNIVPDLNAVKAIECVKDKLWHKQPRKESKSVMNKYP